MMDRPTRFLNCCALVFLAPALALAAATPIAAAAGNAPTSQPVTWAHDVAPLVYAHCATCHHPGGAGPFSIIGYPAARRWGPQIVRVTQTHFMPPWLPEPNHGDFLDLRRLSDSDVALLKKWVDAGMPQGNPAEAPPPPLYDATWQLGKPDLVLTTAAPYTLQPNGTDVFRNFIFPNPLQKTRYVRAMEIRPNPASVVHHANVLIDRLASLRLTHPNDWQQSVSGMEILLDAGNTFDPDSHFLFWKTDTPALVEAEGMPWRLDPGNDLILNIHLKPSGKPEQVEAQIGLYFTDQPPTKQPMLLQLDRDDLLDIPPGDKNFVVEDQLTLPVDVSVLGIYPHAHYLGKDMQGWAILPDGSKKWLVWIKDWDIDRQSVYRYREPIALPKGTVLHMRYVYDNSEDNVHNPTHPPVRVRAGNRSEDEMSHMWLQVLPALPAPGQPDPRLLLEEAWMRNRLSKSPDDRVTLYNLGAALNGEGRFQQAVQVYERSRGKHPADARLLTAEGVAFNGEGDWRKAHDDFAAAVADPDASHAQHCDAQYDLASLDLRHQQLNSAQQEFRAMAADCPTDAGAHSGLGATLSAVGHPDTAIPEFRASLAIDPNNLEALSNLGALDLDAADSAATLAEAVKLLAQAAQLDPNNADRHTDLARAWAQSGDLSKAESELRQAIRLRPQDAQTHSALSQVLAANGSLMAAISEQKAALAIVEDDPDGWNNLGVMEARSGITQAARADFTHALRLNPNHAQAQANLARLGIDK